MVLSPSCQFDALWLGCSIVREPAKDGASQTKAALMLRRWRWRSGLGRRWCRVLVLRTFQRGICEWRIGLREIRLHFDFLIRDRVDFGFERPISGQSDFDLVRPRRDFERAADAFELSNVADEASVKKDSGAIRIYGDLYNRPGCRHNAGCRLHHRHLHDAFFARPKNHFLGEILIAVLANRDVVLAGEPEDFLRAFQFLEISDILSVDPDAGSFFDFRFSLKINFSHHFVSRVEHHGDHENRDCENYIEPR